MPKNIYLLCFRQSLCGGDHGVTSGRHSALWSRPTMFDTSERDRHTYSPQPPLLSDHSDFSEFSDVLAITHNELYCPLAANSLCQKSNAFEKVLHLLYL